MDDRAHSSELQGTITRMTTNPSSYPDGCGIASIVFSDETHLARRQYHLGFEPTVHRTAFHGWKDYGSVPHRFYNDAPSSTVAAKTINLQTSTFPFAHKDHS